MIGIDISKDGNVLQCKCYKIKNGKKTIVPYNNPVHELIEALEQEEINNIKLLDKDIMFDTDNAKVVIRDYAHTNKLNGMQVLRSKINQYYRIQQLKRKKVKRQNAFKRAVVISGVLAIGFVGVKTMTNIKKNDVYIPTDDITIENQVDNEITENDSIVFEEPEVLEKPEVVEDTTPKVNIDFDNRTDSSKFIKAKELYSDLITKYANRYGVDPNLMLAVATHERGVHSDIMDSGGALGLMQVQYSVWVNKNIQVFNYETNSYETLNITDQMIRNVEGNIRLGCMIMQDNLNRLNNNPLLSLQAYNYGYPCASACVSAYAKDNNLSYKEAVSDYTNTGWMNYREIIGGADPIYVEHVLSYMGDEFKIENMSRDGVIALRVSNEAEARTYS